MLATMVVVLPVFWTMGQLGRWWTPPLMAVVMAVMLGVSLPRVVDSIRRVRWAQACVALIVCVLVAGMAGVGSVAGGWWRVLGGGIFALLAAWATWVRRWGAAWRSVGLVASVAVISVLVSPMPSQASWTTIGWMALAGLVACVWTVAVAFLSRSTDPSDPPPPALARGRRLLSSTRMAVQLLIAVGAAFVAADLIDSAHLVWPVLTAVIVLTNNRGRGDVLWKGAQRLVGALIGTVAATLLVGAWPAGDSRSVVAIFVVIAVAAAVRVFGYVYWAACVTAGLAFLYGYMGQGGVHLLGHRVLGIVVGGVIAAVAAWFVLPVRTTDVVRSRMGAVRSAMGVVASERSTGVVSQQSLTALREARRQLAVMLPTVKAAKAVGIGSVRRLSVDVKKILSAADTVLDGSS